ncbi:MAG: Tat-linked quality control protein TatD [Parcubacteria group bacterium ADurb.Bin159]|nr:MAG: Tat-linked quality control protein TatD [Parcubacteria group bacterium ADurb.Bin159]
MFDVHSHLNFKAFEQDEEEVIRRSFGEGLSGIINIGSNFATSQKAINIAQRYKNCWAAVGLHPIHIHSHKQSSNFYSPKYYLLIEKNKKYIKAIGETGLDFYHSKNEDIKYQKEVFLAHLDMAKKFNLPVILHCRGSKDKPKDAYLKILEILKKYKNLPQGEIHCFSADFDIAQEFLNLGFYIGFTGVITFENADKDVLETIKKMPLSKILAETDCPFLTPEPYRGKRNEPHYVRLVVEKISQIKNLSFRNTEKNIDDNAKRLFNLRA